MRSAYLIRKISLILGFTLSLVIPSIDCLAQFIPFYNFSQSSGIYNSLSGQTVLAAGLGFDDERYSVNLPFNFTFDNVSYSSVYIAMNGFISFGNTDPGSGYWMINSSQTGFRVVSGFDYNLSSLNNNTELSYSTLGASPNRIFVAQWKNMGAQGSLALTANFQIRLYETSNVVEVMYGYSVLNTGSVLSVQLGLRGLNNSSFLNRTSSNSNWSSTTAGSNAAANIIYNGGSNPSSGQTYQFTPPPPCNLPGAANGLSLTSTTNSVSGSFSPSNPTATNYLVVRTQNAPLSVLPVNGVQYSGTLGNGTIVQSSNSTNFTNGGLNPITSYRYTIIPFNQGSCIGPVYQTNNILSDTILTKGPRKYVWLPTSGSADFQLAGNWLPNRTFTDPLDTLIFNQGGQSTAINVPAQSLAGIEVSNSTNVTLSAALNDSLTLSKFLTIQYGTALHLGGTNKLKILFLNAAGKRAVSIDGLLSLDGNSVYNTRYSISRINGIVRVNHGSALFSNTCSTCYDDTLNFKAGSRLELMKDSAFIPYGIYDTTSTVFVTNIVQQGPTMVSVPVSTYLGNLVLDFPQAVVNTSIPNAINRIYGNLIIRNTGIGSLSMSNKIVYGRTDFLKGQLNILSGMYFQGDVMLDTGKVSVYASTAFYADLTTTSKDTLQVYSANTVVSFSGPGQNHVDFFGQYIGGQSLVVLDNPFGAQFNGQINLSGTDKLRIDQGSWTGPGVFQFGGNASLEYNHLVSHVATATEWPAVNGPHSVTVNLESGSPDNRLYLPGHRSIPGTLFLYDGVIVLDNSNLSANTLTLPATTGPQIDTNRMIATTGNGYYYANFPTGTSNQIYPLGDLTNAAEVSPGRLYLTGNTAARYIGIRVKDALHPNAGSNAPVSRYWEVIDTTATASYTYNLKISPDGSEILSNSIKMQAWDGSVWQTYPSVLSGDTLQNGVFISGSSYPISRTFTGFVPTVTPATTVYTWNGSVNQDYQVAANWTPARTILQPSDQLVFSDGLLDSIVNIPNQVIGRMSVLNQTHVLLTSNNIMLSLASDNDTTTNELYIATGSTLRIKASNQKMNFINQNNRALIEGRLELQNSSTTNVIDFSNCVATVSASGILASGGNSTGQPFLSDATMLRFFGTYEHKYTTTPGYIPFASWKPGSLVQVIGALSFTLSNNGVANGFRQTFYNFTYNAPNQYGNTNFGLDTVQNNFRMISTGTGTWKGAVLQSKNFFQQGGKIDLSSTNQISDSLIQTQGILKNPIVNNQTQLIFNGTANQQVVSCYDSSFAGEFMYTIRNPYGIQLNGTGNFSINNIFKINKKGGLTIQTNAMPPITTTLTLRFDTLDSELKYNYTGNLIADAVCFPASNGPSKMTTDLGAAHQLSIPFDRTLASLNMLSGDINIQSNTLTLGKSSTQAGSLSYSEGYIITSTGFFKRRISINNFSNLNELLFPLGDGQHNRSFLLKSLTLTSVTQDGFLQVRHVSLPGNQTGLSIPDGLYTVTEKSNSYWELGTDASLTLGPIIQMYVITDGINMAGNPGDWRLFANNTMNGTHVNFTNPSAFMRAGRAGLTLSQMTAGTYHVGGDGLTPPSTVYSVNNGTWNNPATWNINAIPNQSHQVIISPTDTVILNAAGQAKSIQINSGASFIVQSDSIHVDSLVHNYGRFVLDGGVLDLGPAGGGNRMFKSEDSIFIHNGTLRVNGGFYIIGDAYHQTGGTIIVDGNGASASYTTPYVNITPGYTYATGGSLQIVDPHSLNTDVFFGGGFGPGHTLILGNGVSTVAGGLAGFSLYTTGSLGNLSVLSTPSVASRICKIRTNTSLYGQLSLIDSNAYLNMNGYTLEVGGDIWLDSFTTLITNGTLRFKNTGLSYGTLSIPSAPQTLYSNGILQNLTTAPSANFSSLEVNNTSLDGVSINSGNLSYSQNLVLTAGKLAIGASNTLTGLTASSASSTSGWLHGKLKMYINSGSSSNHTFPVGDSLSASKAFFSILSNQTVVSPGFLTVQAVTPDHPGISSSPVHPNLSLNRWFRIDTSGGLVFGPGFADMSFHFPATDVDPLANYSNFIIAQGLNGNWNTLAPTSVSPVLVGTSRDFRFIQGDYILGENQSVPLIVSQATNQNVCAGDNASFSITSNVTNQFQWQVNPGTGFVNLQNSAIYSGVYSNQLLITNATTTMNGYQYRCVVSNAIGSVTSNSVTLQVGTGVLPAISISSLSGTTICASDTVSFQATYNNGGSNPMFEWYLNGVALGINAPNIQLSSLPANAQVSCSMTSSSTCATQSVVSSNVLNLNIIPTNTPTVSISSNVANPVCAGTNVVFTAVPINGGPSPSYVWTINGSPVGTSSPVFSTSTLLNGDIVSCQMQSNAGCLSTSTAMSNPLTIQVNAVQTPVVSITSNLGNTICAGNTVTFTATAVNGGSNPQFNWFKNGVPVGSSASSYTDNTLNSGDQIYCVLTSNLSCVTQSTDTSNIITMQVNPVLNPSVSIAANPSDTICSGTSVTFSPNIINSGPSVTYSWLLNTVQVASGSTYTSSTLANGDQIQLLITTSPLCATQPTTSSNSIQMVVNPLPIPSIQISANPGTSVCAGDSVTFTAIAQSGGSAPVFQWKKNNLPVGSNTPVYGANNLQNGDVIVCEMQSNASCAGSGFVSSNALTMTVTAFSQAGISIQATPVNPVCAGTLVNFSASISNGGSAPTYQWQVNGNNVGSNTASYSSSTLNDGDTVRCILTSNQACVLSNTVPSDSIVLVVLQNVTPGISISASPGTIISSGTTVTFTAVANQGGSNPVYQWKLNTVNVGTNSNTYITNTLQDGDEVSCTIISSEPCASPTQVNSNMLKISIPNGLTAWSSGLGTIQVYPNPTEGRLILEGICNDPGIQKINYELLALTGQHMQSGTLPVNNNKFLQELQFDESINNGIYFLKLSTHLETYMVRITLHR